MDTVHVINTQPRIFHLPPEVKAEEVIDGAGNKQTRHRVIGQGIAVSPSAPREKDGKALATVVPVKDWERAKKNAQVRVWLKNGWIKLAESFDEQTGEERKSVTLMGFGVNTALTVIEGEDDKKLLSDWLRTEARDEIKDALKNRLSALSQVAKK
jgi:hypothetical protein